MAKLEQIDPHITKPRECKRLKKTARRWLRRAGKRDPENAPRKYWWAGWSS